MQNRVIALGFFDGVHLGHGALMKKAVLRAKELGVRSAVFTFDRLPRGAVTGAQVDLINSSADREKLIRRFYGVDEVMVVPFDDAMRTMSWDRFIEDLLVGELGARHLVVGDDHRFGYKGEGTAEKLKEKCRAMGIGCDVIEQVEVNGERVSSTYIRSMIATGDMEKASENELYDYRVLPENVSVLKVANHGSAASTRFMPLSKLNPIYSVISVGENDSGCPSEDVLLSLDQTSDYVYRTDKHGTVVITTDGAEITVKTDKDYPTKTIS